jgi:hypothetical protein
LNTINWEDILEKQRKAILGQQCTLMSVKSTKGASIASSLMGTTTSIIRHSNVTLHQDAIILSLQSTKPQISITIHSFMPHLTLQTGRPNEQQDYPAQCCILDSGASVSTANFHYIVVIKWYPHILKAIYLI